MRKNIRLLSILFIFISVFFVSGVQADTKDITIDSISVNKRNGQVQVDNLTLGDNKLTSKIVFNKVDDYVHFKVKLNNSSSDNYKIISISDNNKNDNISISYEYSKDYFKKNADVIVKIKYEKQLNGVEKISLNDLTITFSLEREDGAQSQIVVNPTTNDSILHYLVLLIISLAGIVIVVIKKKKKIGTFLLVFATILIPFAAIANERFEVKLKLTNIDIMGKVESPSVDPSEPEDYAILVSGEIFNSKLQGDAISFRKATEEEYNSVKDDLTTDNIISVDESPKIVYMWKSGEELIYYSDASIIYLNENSSSMFNGSSFTLVDLSGLNSSRTTNMSNMFKDSSDLITIDLSSFEITALENMSHMFEDCSSLHTIFVSDKWDARIITVDDSEESEIEDEDMFKGCTNLVGEMETAFDENIITGRYARIDSGPIENGYLTLKGKRNFVILIPGSRFNAKLQLMTTENKEFRKATEEEYNTVKDNLTTENIVSLSKITIAYMWETSDAVVYYSEVDTIYMNPDSSHMFENTGFDTITLSDLDSRITTDMSYMFYNCTALTDVDFEADESNEMGYIYDNKLATSVVSLDNKFIILIPILFVFVSSIAYVLVKKLKFDKTKVTAGGIALVLLVVSLTVVLSSFGLNKLLASINDIENDNSSSSRKFDTSHVTNMSHMFEGCTSLTEIDLSSFDISSLTNMDYMFKGCTSLETIYVSDKWDAKIIYASYYSSLISSKDMFKGCVSLIGEKGTSYREGRYGYLDDGGYAIVDGTNGFRGYLTLIGHEKEAQRTAILLYGNAFNNTMVNIITGSSSSEPGIGSEYGSESGSGNSSEQSNTDPTVFREGTRTEYNAVKDSLTDDNLISAPYSDVEVYGWITENAFVYYSTADIIYLNPDSSHMFSDRCFEKIDLSGLSSDLLEDASEMFRSNYDLIEVDISSFDTSKSFNMNEMFMSSQNLERIFVSELWNPNTLGSHYDIFDNCDSLIGGKGTYFSSSYDYGEHEYAQIDGGETNPGYLTLKGDNNIDAYIDNYSFGYLMESYYDYPKTFRPATEEEYNSYKSKLNISNIILNNKYKAVYAWKVEDELLYYSEANNIYINNSGYDMFNGSNFEYIDISKFDFTYVTSMENMFRDCVFLKKVVLGVGTQNITEMSNMFSGCTALEEIDFGDDFDTSKVEYMSNMFYGCSSLTELDLSSFNTVGVTNMSYMFYGCSSLTELDLSSFELDSLYYMDYMFYDCSSLRTIYVSDLWNVIYSEEGSEDDSVSADYAFYGCTSLVGELGTTYDENNYNGSYANVDEGSSKPGYLTLKGGSTNAILIEGYRINDKFAYMTTSEKTFRKATVQEYNSKKNNLTDDDLISTGNKNKVYMWETDDSVLYYSEAENIYLNSDSSRMFLDTEFTSIDLSGLLARKVSNMPSMFEGCDQLTSINFGELPNDSSPNLSASIMSAFKGNNMLILIIPVLVVIVGVGAYLLIKKLKANKVEITVGIIVFIIVVSSLVIAFSSLGLNKLLASVGELGNNNNNSTVTFDTSRVKSMGYMFDGCSSLTELDLSSFSTDSLTDISYMFRNCSSLETIYVSDRWDPKITEDSEYPYSEFEYSSSELFLGCVNLVGEKGTRYNENHNFYFFNRVDGGYGSQGYFTLKGHTKSLSYALLLDDSYFGSKVQSILWPDYNYTTLKSFRPATEEEYNAVRNTLTEDNIISEPDSPLPVYVWLSSDEGLYYSESDVIYLNKYASYIFSDLYVENIDLSIINTSYTKSMYGMFLSNSYVKTLDLSSFTFENVSDLSSMFSGCSELTTIYAQDWNVDLNDLIFFDNGNLVGGAGTTYNSNNRGLDYAHIDGGDSNPGYFTDVSAKTQN